MYAIFTYMYHKNQPNVDKYTIPMDPMGYGEWQKTWHEVIRWPVGCCFSPKLGNIFYQTSTPGVFRAFLLYLHNSGWYCWWLKSCTGLQVVYPIMHRASYIPGGARFQPSTGSLALTIETNHPYTTWKGSMASHSHVLVYHGPLLSHL